MHRNFAAILLNGLRDYGTAQWNGGDAACDHTGIRRNHSDEKQASSAGTSRDPVSRSCLRCGATRVDRQIGLEATPDEYLATMVAVFREVRRVLRRDGTCWVNMGDSYANTGNTAQTDFSASQIGYGGRGRGVLGGQPAKVIPSGLKPKDLLMMPARLALALQADGWWLRSDIIWHKPNPMPESVTDRPTSAHEHVFLLTKSARYFYDADAIAEPSVYPDDNRKGRQRAEDYQSRAISDRIATINPSNPQTYPMRSCRNVWTIATAPYSEAHFATFPPALAERCIRAGTSERGCCGQCGKPWVRVTERTAMVIDRSERTHPMGRTRASGTMLEPPTAVTTGWRAGCDHEAPTVPCTVLDPFAGAGTTLLVADRLQRDAIGIELNVAYTEMAMERCKQDAPLFVDVPAADPEDERMADLFAEAAE